MRFDRDRTTGANPIKLLGIAQIDPDRSVTRVVDGELVAWVTSRQGETGSKIKVSTWKSYESHARVHLLTDAIADWRVSDLTTTDIEDLFRRLLDKGLSPASVDAVRRTLRRA